MQSRHSKKRSTCMQRVRVRMKVRMRMRMMRLVRVR